MLKEKLYVFGRISPGTINSFAACAQKSRFLFMKKNIAVQFFTTICVASLGGVTGGFSQSPNPTPEGQIPLPARSALISPAVTPPPLAPSATPVPPVGSVAPERLTKPPGDASTTGAQGQALNLQEVPASPSEEQIQATLQAAESALPHSTPQASPLPVKSAEVGAMLDTEKAADQAVPTPTPDPLESSLSPQNMGLPDALTDEPIVPKDLLSPIPSPPVQMDKDTARASEATLEKLRAAAKGTDAPPSAKKMTLEQTVDFALNHNPDVLRAIEQIRLTSGQLISVRAQILPQLTATSSYQFLEQSLAGPGTSSFAAPQNRFWNFQFGISQLLFDSGAAVSGIISAKNVEISSYFQLRKVIDDTIANVKMNFFQIILNRSLIVAQEQSVALLESQLQDQINRYEAGTVPRFNVLQAEVALANAIPPLIQARNNLRISQFQLVRLIGLDYDQSNPALAPFDVVGDLNANFRKINTDESIRTALIRSPELKAQRQDILAQAANVNVQLAGYGPKISATAGYEWQNDPTFRDLTQTLDGWFFGFQGSWNIFDGFLTAGNVKQAKARLMQSKILYDNTVRSVILTVQEAISNLQEAKETIDSQQASVEQATEALRLSRERLDAGAGTQLDVLNAQVSLLQAQTTLLQAQYSYIEALAQYDAALSLDTQWEEAFEDPLAAPEKRRFIQINAPDRPTAKLPRAFRNQDPVQEILSQPDMQEASGAPAVKEPTSTTNPSGATPKATPKATPQATPKATPKAGRTTN